MASNSGTRVSAHFKLGRSQPYLDFVDVPIGKDVAVFLDPGRLRGMSGTWASECISLIQSFFEALLRQLKANNKSVGIELLSALSERNEFHLGLSKGRSKGSAFGDGYAEAVWEALVKSKASRSGLLKDLEDTALFIHGIGPDRISDAVSNIIRGPLIQYTQSMCAYYGIPLTPDVDSGPIWNPQKETWEDSLIPLPVTPFGKLLLVPKLAVRQRIWYTSSEYVTHYLLPAMQEAEKKLNSGLVQTLKDGRKRVTKKSLLEKYGADKLAIVDETVRLPEALEKYRRDRGKRISVPLSHSQLADIENVAKPNFRELLASVVAVKPGKDEAGSYEDKIEKLLSALLFPSLSFPTKQDKIHEARKRIDITYVNNAHAGLFRWFSEHYPSSHIFVECKNYGKEVGNPELDQLSGRFSPGRGMIGLLVCRSVDDAARLAKRCRDTANDGRGYIMTLTDEDLKVMVEESLATDGDPNYAFLRAKFKKLVM